jgi:hypothetical protein
MGSARDRECSVFGSSLKINPSPFKTTQNGNKSSFTEPKIGDSEPKRFTAEGCGEERGSQGVDGYPHAPREEDRRR